MATKKIIKVFGLSLIGLLALTGCDEIVATPKDYEDQLVEPKDFSDEIYNNIASVVYDSIHESGIGSDVLNQVLYLYAVNTFGPYNSQVVVNNQEIGDSQITLEEAANDDSKIDAFILAHRGYWNDSKKTSHPEGVSDSERERVRTKYNTVNDRIAEEMYNKISSGSYSDRHIFSEDTFLKSLRSSLESVADPSTIKAADKFKGQILPNIEPEEVFINEETGEGYLHRDYYESDDNHYIVEDIIPTIYRQLLSEQYLLEETYNTLGRSYARKVNVIKLKTNDNYPNAAYYLAKALVAEINATGSNYKIPEGEDGLLNRFKQYSNAYIGVIDESTEEGEELANILKDRLEKVEDTPAEIGTYWKGTAYGDTAEKYIEMKNVAENGVNSELENLFTNNGAYPAAVGLQQEIYSLQENDYTFNGWYVKNGGLTELPESVRSRLFNIGVANGVKESEDDIERVERTYDSKYGWQEGEIENAYVCRINGRNYLKTASRVKGDSIENDILHYDADSKTYYIVEIVEAVSSSKLSKNGSRNYIHTRGDDGEEIMQNIINEVTKVIGTGESYATLATKKYLKEMSIEYHDESVYNYFKDNYPELFDEEAEESSDEEQEETSTPAEVQD